jgi:hypothetical protein
MGIRGRMRVVERVHYAVGHLTDNMRLVHIGVVVKKEDNIKGITDNTKMCWIIRSGVGKSPQ